MLTASSNSDEVELLLRASGELPKLGVDRESRGASTPTSATTARASKRSALHVHKEGRGGACETLHPGARCSHRSGFRRERAPALIPTPVWNTAERKAEPQLLLCSEVLSGEAALRICGSKQHRDRRDHNTNSLITLARLLEDICSRRHFSLHSGQRERNGPKQQQQKRKNQTRKKKGKEATADRRDTQNSPMRITAANLEGLKSRID